MYEPDENETGYFNSRPSRQFYIDLNAQPRGKKRLNSNFQGELKRPRALTGTKTFVDTTRLSAHPKGTFLGHIVKIWHISNLGGILL